MADHQRSEDENGECFEAIINSDELDDNSSNPDCTPDASPTADSDSEEFPLDERLSNPTKYFQELDELEAKVFGNSMFQFYKDGSKYKPFNGHFHMKVGHGGQTQVRLLNEDDIKAFCEEVLTEVNEQAMNEAIYDITSPSVREHYNGNFNPLLDRSIENMFHLIECRHIIFWVMESLEAMESASYCGTFISILVIDRPGDNVARLVPIQCSKIKQIAAVFETSLSELIQLHRSTALFDTEMTFADSVTEACRDLLDDLGLTLPPMHCTELWRNTVHFLDVAILSYAGTHVQFFETAEVKEITLPGPFVKTQYFVFRRRSFLCLGDFLGDQDAWVLERCHPSTTQLYDAPSLYLSTDAATFADIWGPMWKSCLLRNGNTDHDYIVQYNVGNGVVLPWNLPSSDSRELLNNRKDEVFCHWISDKDISESCDLIGPSGELLLPDSILLIGAGTNTKMQYNQQCNLSTDQSRQCLRDSGSLAELGTMTNTRVLDSETVQIQVSPPYIKAGGQRTYKRRGRTWKQAMIEDWKNNFGVEVSACTYNARRRRLISLLGSNTMLNYLRNGTLQWNSVDCESKFYAALKNENHQAFRELYLAEKSWQADLGKAIAYCLDGLAETGTEEKGFNLLWVPDAQPGQRVNIQLRDHSWIGFLKDTEACCTMAVLEDKCLELPNLVQVRNCQNQENRGKEYFRPTVLETSFILNQNAVPKSMSPVTCHPSNSTHEYRWSTSLLKEGEKFNFGENGQLKCIRGLHGSHILANWHSSWECLAVFKAKLQGRVDGKRHLESIRKETGPAAPILAHISSSGPDSHVGSNSQYVHRYVWVPRASTQPRNPVATSEEMRSIMDRWGRREVAIVERRELDGLREIINSLVAALPAPVESNGGDFERERNPEGDRFEDL